MRYLSLLLFLVSSVAFGQMCGTECNHVDHDFEDWLQLRRSGNRNSDYFT